MSIQSINPATGDVIETFQETTPQELERILGGAQAAFHDWRRLRVCIVHFDRRRRRHGRRI